MCDNWRGCAENWRKEPLASNQVAGSSNLSGRAKFIKHLAHFRKLESSPKKEKFPKNRNTLPLVVVLVAFRTNRPSNRGNRQQ